MTGLRVPVTGLRASMSKVSYIDVLLRTDTIISGFRISSGESGLFVEVKPSAFVYI